MKKDDLLVYGMAAAAAVLVAKAMGFSLSSLTGGEGITKIVKSFKLPTLLNPDVGVSLTTDNVGSFITTEDLINGAIHDYYNGGSQNFDTVPFGQIGQPAQSYVKNPDFLWL